MSPAVRVATRGSLLALRQTQLVLDRLHAVAAGWEVRVVAVEAAGDLAPDTPPGRMAGDGWFTSALERSLIVADADLAVHSAKDLPTGLADGLEVAAYLERADPRDALVTRTGAPWAELPRGARVATGSPRRAAQLAALRPDLELVTIRGNVDTRLRRLDAGAADALVLAMAGLERLGLDARAQPLDPHRECTPAPAQGAIAVEARRDSAIWDALRSLDDASTRARVEAERLVLVRLGGGCRLPLGVLAEVSGTRLELTGAFLPEGARAGPGLRRHAVLGEVDGAPGLAAELAAALG